MTAPPDDCLARNEWICGEYLSTRRQILLDAVVQHLQLTALSVLIALVIAVPLAVLARRWALAAGPVLALTTVLYTIPSLAMFSLLLPVYGLSASLVVAGLVLYSLTLLVRNILAGLRAVPEDTRQAARGMGYGPIRLLLTVELPLALPAAMAGLRIATVSAVSLVTVGAIVGFGGLGNLIYAGMNTYFKAQVLTASVLCVVIAVAADLLLLGVQRLLTPWTRAAGPAHEHPQRRLARGSPTRPHWSGDDGIWHRLTQHLVLTVVCLVISCLIALPVALVLGHLGKGGALAVNISNVGRAVPTFAVLVLLLLTPLGKWGEGPTVVALVLFAVPPLLTNAYVGMRGVDRSVVQAARGMGMTGRQMLWRVELPLALPLVLSGVRIAAVQLVATATIAALAGGGGLGRIITAGFNLASTPQVVAGAVLVAVFALLVEGVFESAERLAPALGARARERRMRRRTGAAAAALLALAGPGLGLRDRALAGEPGRGHRAARRQPAPGRRLRGFTESDLLAQMYALLLNKAGYSTKILSVANRELYEPALESGQIDVVPEYAATFADWLNAKKNGADAQPVGSPDLDATMRALRRLATPRGLTVLDPGKAVDQNAFAVDRLLRPQTPAQDPQRPRHSGLQVRLAAGDECVKRPYCEPGLKKVYGIDITGVDPKGVGTTQAKKAVQNGQDQMVLTTSTDATLDDFGLVLLTTTSTCRTPTTSSPSSTAPERAAKASPTPSAASTPS